MWGTNWATARVDPWSRPHCTAAGTVDAWDASAESAGSMRTTSQARHEEWGSGRLRRRAEPRLTSSFQTVPTVTGLGIIPHAERALLVWRSPERARWNGQARCFAQLERGHGQPNSTAAVAAAKQDRPGWGALAHEAKDVEGRRFDAVVIYSTSRLARDRLERTLSVLNRTPRIATPVVVHNLQLIPTRDPRHTMLAATQIAAIRSLILLAKDGER
jgi:hypothetical protein